MPTLIPEVGNGLGTLLRKDRDPTAPFYLSLPQLLDEGLAPQHAPEQRSVQVNELIVGTGALQRPHEVDQVGAFSAIDRIVQQPLLFIEILGVRQVCGHGRGPG
jgi:hypothetical protein